MKNLQIYILILLAVIAVTLIAGLFKYDVAHLESNGASFIRSNILGTQVCALNGMETKCILLTLTGKISPYKIYRVAPLQEPEPVAPRPISYKAVEEVSGDRLDPDLQRDVDAYKAKLKQKN